MRNYPELKTGKDKQLAAVGQQTLDLLLDKHSFKHFHISTEQCGSVRSSSLWHTWNQYAHYRHAFLLATVSLPGRWGSLI